MRRIGLLAVLCGLGVGAWPSGAAAAVPPITTYFNDCPAYGAVRVCTGEVPSFDGSKLDVDLTLPNTGGARHPLIVMLHGFGNNKREWESTTPEGDGADKYRWNSRWLADNGYYVLTYTARGFRDGGPYAPYQPATPGGGSEDLSPPASSGTLHVKSRDFEIKDTQWLSALVAAAYPDVDPGQVAVTGGSYGGGESWVQASQPRWTFPNQLDSSLPVLKLQVAVPKYPWTDLGYSLAPNGHGGGPSKQDIYESSQGEASSDTGDGNPIGTAKASYITGLFAKGEQTGTFEEGQSADPGPEGPINIPAWNTRIVGGGDPYDVAGVEDAVIKQARRGLTEFRSAYYQDKEWAAQVNQRKVAVFSISGWTDDLFEAVESFREFKYLKRLNPLWPVSVAVADVGHSPAQNQSPTWQRLNAQAFQWLQSNIGGSHDQQTTVYSEPTLCADAGDPTPFDVPSERLTSTSPEGLSNGTLNVAYSRPGVLTQASGAEDPDGPATDPILGPFFDSAMQLNGTCQESARKPAGPATTGYTAVSRPLPTQRIYLGLGYVRIPYALTGTTATLQARVWDVNPVGRTVLITRGTYRIDVPAYDKPAGILRLPLYGNHWPLRPGHQIRLDLQQVDQPTFRPGNVASSIGLSSPTLVLPTRQAGNQTLPGS